MARYLGPTCKLSRREGTDLFLKSSVRPAPNQSVRSESTYIASTVSVEVTFLTTVFSCVKNKKYVVFAAYWKSNSAITTKMRRQKGNTGENLVSIASLALDNVVYRMGFGATR